MEQRTHAPLPGSSLLFGCPFPPFPIQLLFSRSSSKESIVVNLLKHERWRYMGGPAPQATGCCCLWHMCVPFYDKRAKHLFFLDQNQTSASAGSSHYPSHSGAVFDVVHTNYNLSRSWSQTIPQRPLGTRSEIPTDRYSVGVYTQFRRHRLRCEPAVSRVAVLLKSVSSNP